MARIVGTFPYSANLELLKKAPLDAKALVQYKTDLTSAATWTAADGLQYTYVGMLVCVAWDSEVNNGIYRLKYDDYSQIENWTKESSIINEFTINGLNPRGFYNDAADPADIYMRGDLVTVGTTMYFCLNDNTQNIKPSETTDWELSFQPFTLIGAEGKNGNTPYIGENSNWWIAGVDTGKPAEGKNGAPGATPTINPLTNTWWISGTDTGKKAIGENGKEYVPTIDPISKNWFINGVNTGFKAIAEDGAAAIANINLRGDYNPASTYNNSGVGGKTDVVYGSDGNMYYCKVNGTMGVNPVTDTAHTNWYLYSQQGKKGNDAPPVIAQYSETGLEGSFHTIFNPEEDFFIRFSYNNGISWGSPMQFRGPQGPQGAANLSDISTPIGCTQLYSGWISNPIQEGEIPIGYLLEDGSTVLKSEYPELVRKLTGSDEAESAQLPDSRQHFIVGFDPRNTDYNEVGKTGGTNSVTLTAAQSGLPSHKHAVIGSKDFSDSSKRLSHDGASGDQKTSYTELSAAVNAQEAHENRPAFYVKAFIIKASYIGEIRTPYDTYLQTNPNPVLTKEQWLESMRGETGPTGVNPKGDYDNDTEYVEDDVVRINNPLNPEDGNAFVCKVPTVTGVEPGITTDWRNSWYPFVMRGAPGKDAYQLKIKYSPLPVVTEESDWHDTPTVNDVYARFSTDNGATYGSPIRYQGQKGDDAHELQIQYSVDGTTNWHSTANTEDQYVRFSTDGGSTWGNAIKYGGTGSAVLQQELTINLSGGKLFGRLPSGTVIAAGTSLEALIRQATIESINPTATVSATGSIAYNVTAGTLTVNMTSAVNNPGATITGFVLSYRRGSGAWVQLYTGAAKTSHTHVVDALLAADNTSSFSYQLVVTDSTGASTTVTSNAITPAAYAAPAYSVTTQFSTSREMGDISTLIAGTINQEVQNGVSILTRTLQYSLNNSTWTNITTPATNSVNYTHNDAALKDATQIWYRIQVITTSASGNITTNLSLGSVTFAYKNFIGTNAGALSGAGLRALGQATSWNANVGTHHYICLAPGRTLTKVMTSNNADDTSKFVQSSIQIPDAGGYLRNYTQYLYVSAVNYNVILTATIV